MCSLRGLACSSWDITTIHGTLVDGIWDITAHTGTEIGQSSYIHSLYPDNEAKCAV